MAQVPSCDCGGACSSLNVNTGFCREDTGDPVLITTVCSCNGFTITTTVTDLATGEPYTGSLMVCSPEIYDVADTNSIDMSLDGTTFSADVRIDPASEAPVSIGPDGIKIDCCPSTLPAYYRELNSGSFTTTNDQSGPHVLGPSWTTPSVVAGKYLLTVTVMVQVSSTGRTLDAFVRDTVGPITLLNYMRVFLSQSGELHTYTAQREVTLAGGVHTLQLWFKKLSGGGDIIISGTEFMLQRVV